MSSPILGVDDEVTYQTNTVKLIEEFQKKNSKNSLVAELLLITHKRRREFIHGCQERTAYIWTYTVLRGFLLISWGLGVIVTEINIKQQEKKETTVCIVCFELL